MTAIEILRAASRSVPNEDYVRFMAAVDAVGALIDSCRAYDDLRDRLFLLMMSDPRRESLLKQVDEADKLRRAALANVGGAA